MSKKQRDLDQSKISRILGSTMKHSKRPGFGNTVANPQSNDEPCHPSRCPSCRVPFVDHVGLISTCEKLLAVQQENVKLREALGGLIGYASSVDVGNVPWTWVRGLAHYINRAMEAMGLEDRYVVVGGKIVKAVDE